MRMRRVRSEAPSEMRQTRITATVGVVVPGAPELTSSCQVMIWRPSPSLPPVAVLSELPGNTGISVSAAFPAVASRIRELLPRSWPEPIWVEHWPQRAVAAVLLCREGLTTNVVVNEIGGVQTRAPLPPSALSAVVSERRGRE